ncbi:helix-turn-helix transcriptional regulator [Pediococcus ethanolidurans]|uniref:AraC-type DNA-binding protein n=1 Tax=Pediococcus ethanolidurans TaxID=319653 RepID=A0A0R2JZS6_9LACO|nr:helix-turn-helix transcriptional regulator [Pediococcus ethanolidurans]KRN82782.1 transcription regulator [Pediococcus ethanolidurans]GEN94796.1 AraC family transcriptional regulator [Pediococcus ethanolidurans]SER41859.1 AraC-type DNA-binding protein [Pediococcus ethanolidurans]
MKIAVAQQFQNFLTTIGISLTDILQKAQIPNRIQHEELKLTTLEYYRLLQGIDAVISDDQLLSFSDIDNINMFMPPFFAALCSHDGLTAIQRLAKYKQLVGPLRLEFTKSQQTFSIHFAYVYPNLELPRFALLNEQLLLISLVRKGTGQTIKPLLMTGPYPLGVTLQDYVGTAAQLTTDNQIVFQLTDLAQPFLTGNNTMLTYLEPQMQQRITAVGQAVSFTSVVQSRLYTAIPAGAFTLEDIASGLGVSVRTLQRNLSAENTTFNQQIKYIQKTLALGYLKDPKLTVAEIAYLVGYADPSSFSRAFKGWTGQTISQYR